MANFEEREKDNKRETEHYNPSEKNQKNEGRSNMRGRWKRPSAPSQKPNLYIGSKELGPIESKAPSEIMEDEPVFASTDRDQPKSEKPLYEKREYSRTRERSRDDRPSREFREPREPRERKEFPEESSKEIIRKKRKFSIFSLLRKLGERLGLIKPKHKERYRGRPRRSSRPQGEKRTQTNEGRPNNRDSSRNPNRGASRGPRRPSRPRNENTQ